MKNRIASWPFRRGRSGGSLLLENLMALGIISTLGLGVVGLMATGLAGARQTEEVRRYTAILQALQIQIQNDPAWLRQEVIYFDHSGRALSRSENAALVAELNIRPLDKYRSRRLVRVEVLLQDGHGGREVARTHFLSYPVSEDSGL